MRPVEKTYKSDLVSPKSPTAVARLQSAGLNAKITMDNEFSLE
jgi:hypothetical protein